MLFLLEYKRSEGRIVALKTFDDTERSKAERSRFQMELELNQKKIDHEVVLLDAADEQALRRTHRRYFEDVVQIANALNGSS